MIKLGGNIILDNFDSIDPGTLVVVKKIIGNYAKKVSEKTPFTEFKVTIIDTSYKLALEIKTDSETLNNEVHDKNLFFALNKLVEKFM